MRHTTAENATSRHEATYSRGVGSVRSHVCCPHSGNYPVAIGDSLSKAGFVVRCHRAARGAGDGVMMQHQRSGVAADLHQVVQAMPRVVCR